jgi:hypothetical protein
MIIKSFIKSNNNINSLTKYNQRRTISYKTRLYSIEPLSGIEIGIPLNIFSNVYTNLHYGYNITTIKIVLLQFLIGYYTYGKDRYNDAINSNNNTIVKDKKKKLYEEINNNQELYNNSINLSLLCIISLLLIDENYIMNIPFIFLLLSTEYYTQIKMNIGIIKPVYIGLMWTMSTLILPCVLKDNDYSILNYPLDYLPEILILFATSNLADIDDIEEDKNNNIETLPVKYGEEKSLMITIFAISLSSLLFGMNKHYIERPLINSLVELQNIFIAYSAYKNYKNKR